MNINIITKKLHPIYPQLHEIICPLSPHYIIALYFAGFTRFLRIFVLVKINIEIILTRIKKKQ